MSEFVSPQDPQQKSVRTQMEEAVQSLVHVGKLQFVDKNVTKHAPYFIEPVKNNPENVAMFVEVVDIYTAPPVPLAPKESVLNRFRDTIRDEIRHESFGSAGRGKHVLYASITSSEHIGELSVKQLTTTETTVAVTVDSSLQAQNTTNVQMREDSCDIQLLGQTSIKIYPSIKQAELGYQFDKNELGALEYNAAVKKVQRQELLQRVKRKVGLGRKKQ